MKSDFFALKHRMEEIALVKPNDFGFSPINTVYRTINPYFKKAPFLIVVPFSLLIAIVAYLLLGLLVVRLVNILQNGF